LHRRGIIKFYTRGDWAVKLTDKDGLSYIIGTQKPDELLQAIKKVNH
jgi:predicted DNA-binding transcriptional regulator